jgi:hypothetical protein
MEHLGSTLFRDPLDSSEALEGAAFSAYVAVAEGLSVREEMNQMEAGECQ